MNNNLDDISRKYLIEINKIGVNEEGGGKKFLKRRCNRQIG